MSYAKSTDKKVEAVINYTKVQESISIELTMTHNNLTEI